MQCFTLGLQAIMIIYCSTFKKASEATKRVREHVVVERCRIYTKMKGADSIPQVV